MFSLTDRQVRWGLGISAALSVAELFVLIRALRPGQHAERWQVGVIFGFPFVAFLFFGTFVHRRLAGFSRTTRLLLTAFFWCWVAFMVFIFGTIYLRLVFALW